MTENERARAAEWLREQADKVEAEEPYAHSVIDALREASYYLDTFEEGED